MAKTIEPLSHDIIGQLREEGQQNYVDDNIFISLSVVDFQQKNLQLNQPYRVENGRLVCVTSGWTHCLVNLEEFRLHERMMLIIPPDSLFEILEHSNDFDMQAMSLKDMLQMQRFGRSTLINANDDEWLLTQEYFNLLWHEVHRPPVMPELVKSLQAALLFELERIGSRQEKVRLSTASRQEIILNRFIEAVNLYGTRERKIEFYADKLCLTPNHLGAVIKKTSGLTVMQWLNRHVIQLAKVMLKYSDLPVWEVAEQLNFANPSFFTKFFKKETGLTPGKYRHSE